jgi:predicted AAA+ superfamily ATPase
MSISNRERLRRSLDDLKAGLIPFVEREMKARVGPYWREELASRHKFLKVEGEVIQWDTQAVLKAMVDSWQSVFKFVLGPAERGFVSELLEVRNKLAHEEPFTSDDAYRALDTMQRLLQALSAVDQAAAIGEHKAELQRAVFAEQARNKTRYQLALEGMPQPGLKRWTEVITPHKDVASGQYMQAEFAADLTQVVKGEGSPEYRDPVEFYRRTFITAGLRDLLAGALQRINGTGGDPVLELQTNFGGGKTHSMLALYHLFGGTSVEQLDGLEPVLKAAGVFVPPVAKRAVLVGTAMSPAQPSRKPDGVEVRTMWGELAWQLGGAEGFEMVAASDRAGASPGSDDLKALLDRYSPALVLIDEWVAYARQLVGRHDLPAGSFEAQDSFAQALTEAAKRTPTALVVASIPASKIEVGGENGQVALDVLKNVFERIGKPWRPATGDEGFEIVRRRLFEPIEPGSHAWRDAVVNAFHRMYKENPGDFPSECGEGDYREDMLSCYPVHPELFRRLYDDWSTLDKFQRTRGVLRLLAKVIHRLWESGDPNLLILPSSVPMDDGAVKSELTRYLPDVWEPIISQDVDGPNSTPLKVDQDIRHLGRYSACRRVARALYVGTAPGSEGPTPGVGSERIRLATAQPGEAVATFGDALRRVTDLGRYVHQDGNRYWLSTRANLNRTADDRAKDLLREPDDIYAFLISRVEADKTRGEFAGVHIAPRSSSDIPDEVNARLVILRPDAAHKRGKVDSAARNLAAELLVNRGTQQRLNKNTLVFLAPDEGELEKLMEATAALLAWQSILRDRKQLNLDEFQKSQAETKVADLEKAVNIRVGSTWIWALVPRQKDATATISWEDVRISGTEALAKRTSSKLVADETLMPKLGGVRLRMELDRYLWTGRDHVTFAELADWFARFMYLPRVRSRDTLMDAVRDGASTMTPGDTFATAEGWDATANRFLGLRVGSAPATVTNGTLVVRTDVAVKQIEAEKPKPKPPEPPVDRPGDPPPRPPGPGDDPPVAPPRPPPPPAKLRPTRFVGSVQLDGMRVGRDASRVADEVLAHLLGLSTASGEVRLEITVEVPGGISAEVEGTVRENAAALKFSHVAFEK